MRGILTVVVVVALVASPLVHAQSLIPLPAKLEKLGGRFDHDPAKARVDTNVRGLPPGGYELRIDANGIAIRASDAAGAFYARQTLRQFGPGPFEGTVISDAPRFAHRGFLLDSARHFQPADYVKRTLDLMSRYKLNRFHWHLTDDEGWRFPVEAFPQLTKTGATRARDDVVAKPLFYTRGELREILAFARERHIVVIPEIEMPGHCNAAVDSYPELRCEGGAFEGRRAFCAGNQKTFDFLFKVLDEVCQLFPDSPQIHLGGDERPTGVWEKCPKCQAKRKELNLPDTHALQTWFMCRVNDHLAKMNRRAITWAVGRTPDDVDDIGHDAIVQGWKGESVPAVRAGHDTINSDYRHVYFDYAPTESIRLKRKGLVPLLPMEQVYAFDPAMGLTGESEKRVLGVEACLWTEWLRTPDDWDEQILPRLLALAEVAWTPQARRNYEDFIRRLAEHETALTAEGFKFAK